MTAQENLDKVVTGLKAVNAGDVDGFLALLDPEFKLHLILKPEQLMPQGQLSGREGFRKYLSMLYTAFPGIQLEQTGIQASGHMVYQQILIHGRHSGPLELPNGIVLPATGIKVRMPTEVFHTFTPEGAFISSTGYANLIDIMTQLKS